MAWILGIVKMPQSARNVPPEFHCGQIRALASDPRAGTILRNADAPGFIILSLLLKRGMQDEDRYDRPNLMHTETEDASRTIALAKTQCGNNHSESADGDLI